MKNSERKPKIRVPFFETGVKNYLYGDAVLDYARVIDAAAQKHDIDVLFIAPYTEIRRVSEKTQHLIVMAPYMDSLRPGRGIADVLPEAVYAAGARGVVLNHCERPMSLPAIRQTIERANELGMLTFACADSIMEAKAIAQFEPDIINPEPTELIGSSEASDIQYAIDTLQIIKGMFPHILVEQAAGITTAQQIYDFIMIGNDAAGSASGILNSPDPYALAEEMIYYVRKAKDDRIKQGTLLEEK